MSRPSRAAAAALVGVLLTVAACSGTAAPTTPAPTLNLSTPAASASVGASASAAASTAPSSTPSASPSSTPSPSPTPSPTASPTPEPTAAIRTDVEAAFGALLEQGQLPPGAEADDAKLIEEYEFEPFNANNGIRVVSQTWSGGDAFSTLFQFVYQFPSEADAEAFLREGGQALSETEVGLEPGEAGFLFESILDEVQFYQGEIEAFGITTRNYNYLMRVKNFVMKVFVAGSDVEPSVAEEAAFFAAQNLNSVNVPLDPNATPAPTAAPTDEPSATATTAAGDEYPNSEEAALLEHIPADTAATCERADPFYRLEIDSVACTPQEDLFVDYSSFASVDDVRTAFDSDFEKAEPTPTEDGECTEGNFLSSYTVGDDEDPAGQVMCTTVTASSGRVFKVIEWTNEPMGILGYLQSPTLSWEELIEFWSTKAGPIE
jgi:hypothetical protein